MKITLTDKFIKGLTKPDRQTEHYDAHTSGLVLRQAVSGGKSFVFRYWFNNRSKQYTIGKYGPDAWGLADARREIKKLRKLLDKGIDPVTMRRQERQAEYITFGEVLNRYIADQLPTLRPSTQADRLRRLEVIKKGLGEKTFIKDIRRGEIITFLDMVKRRAPVNAQKLQVALSAVFRFAKDRELVSDNIAAGINIKLPEDRKTKWENLVYTDDEIKQLWTIFSDYSEPVGSFFRFLMVTGQRSGETRMARWDDIDLNGRVWTIPRENTKNKTEHHVPLSDLAIEILERLRPWTKNYVFESLVQSGQPIYHPSKAAQRIKKQTGIDFNAHSLRTTFATRQAAMGTPPQILSKLLNHKRGAGSGITALYDRHDYNQEKRMAVQKWDRELRRIITGERAKIIRMGS